MQYALSKLFSKQTTTISVLASKLTQIVFQYTGTPCTFRLARKTTSDQFINRYIGTIGNHRLFKISSSLALASTDVLTIKVKINAVFVSSLNTKGEKRTPKSKRHTHLPFKVYISIRQKENEFSFLYPLK